MSMLDWAKQEIELAKKHEAADYQEGEFNYGGACYDSALKAFESLCTDGHSGFSIQITKSILNKLILGQPLLPIDDIPEVWDEGITDELDGNTTYQCLRMSSLFKYVHGDGSIKYRDVQRMICVDLDNHNNRFSSGFISKIIEPMFPICMPYSPLSKRYQIWVREFLVDPKNGDFDTIAIISVTQPNGVEVSIDRFLKETAEGFVEIDRDEYNDRYTNRIIKSGE